MDNIPVQPGTYALIIRINDTFRLEVGKLGFFVIHPGIYIYLGSAHGSGGLRGRLKHHFRRGIRPHWHIDYLRTVGSIQAYALIESTIRESDYIPLECQWAQFLSRQPGSHIPIPKFGAGDCSSGCHSHLIKFPFIDCSDYLKNFIQQLDKKMGITQKSYQYSGC
jgi:Uri superfamily endonuclease